MNEKIKELWALAGEYAAQNATGDWEVGPAYQDLFNKKFAELIVKECVGIIEKEIVLEIDRMLTSANERDEALHANKVKHFTSLAVKSYAHFGVGE